MLCKSDAGLDILAVGGGSSAAFHADLLCERFGYCLLSHDSFVVGLVSLVDGCVVRGGRVWTRLWLAEGLADRMAVCSCVM